MKEGIMDLIVSGKELNETINNLANVPEGLEHEKYRIVAEDMVIAAAEKVTAALTVIKAIEGEAVQDKSVEIDLYVDGACSGNPGPGGWAFRIETDTTFIEGSGYTPQATNNQMEIVAAIKGLEGVKEVSPKLRFKPSKVNIFSDSQYLISTMRGEFKRKSNHAWWDELDHAVNGLNVEWHHIAGHSGHEQNERVDSLAKGAITKGVQGAS